MTGTIPSIGSTLLERYAIERELGRGGMAVVHLAEEKKHARKVAIKILRPDVAASVGVERFLREIGIAARLSHPHIVPLIDSGESEGKLYYVSPFIPGGSLRDRIVFEKRLPVPDVQRITRDIAAALDYAHRNGFVHRDVKPENILFADGHALLADFGVAHVASAPGDATEAITESGLAVGTPAYMSPEQATADKRLDGASDIYSLACVVFEMLTGEPPFRGESMRATMVKHVMDTPRPVRALRPDAPLAVERAVAKGLAKKPEERFASVGEFAIALQAHEGDALHFTTATRTVAVLPFVNASADPNTEYLSDGLTDELIDALAKVEGLRVASRTSVFALKGRPQDVRAIGALLGASVVLEGTVRKSGNQLRITAQLTSTDDGRLLWSHRYDRTESDVFAIQDEISNTIVTTLRATWFADLDQPVKKRYTDNVRAYGLYLQGRYAWNKRTQEGVSEGIALFQQAIAEDPDYALAYTGLADSYALQIDYRNIAVDNGFKMAKKYALKALELDESLAEAHASLAWTLFIYDWEWKAAEAEFRRSIELDSRYATSQQWYAFLLASQGRVDESLVVAHTSQELDPASVSIRRALGYNYLYARRYDQARYHLTRAIAMNPAAEESYRVLGLNLALNEQFDEAERALREALALPGAATYTHVTLAYALARAGKPEYAQRLAAELEEKLKNDYVSPVELATLYIALGDNQRALDWAERAYEERRGWMAYLKVHPIVDPLRNEPRFAALLAKMGL
ncbi:MAG TPA: protein kinase [Gemmatimonadaceae bacterium]|nr:protein kinase [Gemmatimonadaceae bacterium]